MKHISVEKARLIVKQANLIREVTKKINNHKQFYTMRNQYFINRNSTGHIPKYEQDYQKGLNNLRKAMQTGLNYLIQGDIITSRPMYVCNKHSSNTIDDYLRKHGKIFKGLYVDKNKKRKR